MQGRSRGTLYLLVLAIALAEALCLTGPQQVLWQKPGKAAAGRKAPHRVHDTIMAPELSDGAACADIPQEHLPVSST